MGLLPINESKSDFYASVEDGQLVLRLKTTVSGGGGNTNVSADDVAASLVKNPVFMNSIASSVASSLSLKEAIVSEISSNADIIDKIANSIAGKQSTIDKLIAGLDKDDISNKIHDKVIVNQRFIEGIQDRLSEVVPMNPNMISNLVSSLKDEKTLTSNLFKTLKEDKDLLTEMTSMMRDSSVISKLISTINSDGSMYESIANRIKSDAELKEIIANKISSDTGMTSSVFEKISGDVSFMSNLYGKFKKDKELMDSFLNLVNEKGTIARIVEAIDESGKVVTALSNHSSLKERLVRELSSDISIKQFIAKDVKNSLSKDEVFNTEVASSITSEAFKAYIADKIKTPIKADLIDQIRHDNDVLEKLKEHLPSHIMSNVSFKDNIKKSIVSDEDFIHAVVSDAKKAGIAYAVANEIKDSNVIKTYLHTHLSGSEAFVKSIADVLAVNNNLKDSIVSKVATSESIINKLQTYSSEKMLNDKAFKYSVSRELLDGNEFQSKVIKIIKNTN